MKQELTVTELVQSLRSDDAMTRTDAWLSAGEVGAPAIAPLADLMVKGELETSRAARRGLWKIVRTIGAPGVSAQDKRAVLEALEGLLKNGKDVAVRREVLWMLSEIADGEMARWIEPFLTDFDLREDARCAIERIPGPESLAILKGALDKVPDDFKMNIVQSLRARGVEVAGYPCQKLVPKS
jgi:HEAT repeat protein